jgi:sporulation protein YabP
MNFEGRNILDNYDNGIFKICWTYNIFEGGMFMDEKILQSLVLENKEILNITGVEGVDNFNDEIVVLITTKGRLTIKGENLAISKLNVDEGKLMVKGNINSLIFSEYEGQREKVSLVKKLFK